MHSKKDVTVTRIGIRSTDFEYNKYDNGITRALNLFLHLSRDPHPKRVKGVGFLTPVSRRFPSKSPYLCGNKINFLQTPEGEPARPVDVQSMFVDTIHYNGRSPEHRSGPSTGFYKARGDPDVRINMDDKKIYPSHTKSSLVVRATRIFLSRLNFG